MSRRELARKKRQTSITMPERAGPHAKLVFAEMRRLNKTYEEVEEGAGVLRATLKAWRHKNYPSLAALEAVLGYLGYDLVPVPRAKVLPADLVAELHPIADRFGLELQTTVRLLVEIVAGIHERFNRPEALPSDDRAITAPLVAPAALAA